MVTAFNKFVSIFTFYPQQLFTPVHTSLEACNKTAPLITHWMWLCAVPMLVSDSRLCKWADRLQSSACPTWVRLLPPSSPANDSQPPAGREAVRPTHLHRSTQGRHRFERWRNFLIMRVPVFFILICSSLKWIANAESKYIRWNSSVTFFGSTYVALKCISLIKHGFSKEFF